MQDPTQVVNPEPAQAPVDPTPTLNNEQVPAVDPTPTPGTDVAENLKRALAEERNRRREAEARAAEAEARQQATPQALQEDISPIERQFHQTVANSDLAILALKDPFIRENIDLIQNEAMTTGADIISATNSVKARILDTIRKESAQPPAQQVPPTQIQSAPLPETSPVTTSGNAWQDAKDGKLDLNEEEKYLVDALNSMN